MLLMHCWDSKGPVPLDERKIYGISNARSGDEIEALRRVLQEFFVKMEDGWYNTRMQREVERSENISSARSIAGKLGYQAKAKQLPNKSQASASTPTPTPILQPIKSNALSGKPDEAIEVLNFLNSKAGRAYRATRANLELIRARLKDGATVQDCKQVIARKVMDWLHDDKMRSYLRPATLFNRTKFDQYTGELVI